MLGSACLPAIFVCAQVFFCPESPRWLMSKGRCELCLCDFECVRPPERSPCRYGGVPIAVPSATHRGPGSAGSFLHSRTPGRGGNYFYRSKCDRRALRRCAQSESCLRQWSCDVNGILLAKSLEPYVSMYSTGSCSSSAASM